MHKIRICNHCKQGFLKIIRKTQKFLFYDKIMSELKQFFLQIKKSELSFLNIFYGGNKAPSKIYFFPRFYLWKEKRLSKCLFCKRSMLVCKKCLLLSPLIKKHSFQVQLQTSYVKTGICTGSLSIFKKHYDFVIFVEKFAHVPGPWKYYQAWINNCKLQKARDNRHQPLSSFKTERSQVVVLYQLATFVPQHEGDLAFLYTFVWNSLQNIHVTIRKKMEAKKVDNWCIYLSSKRKSMVCAGPGWINSKYYRAKSSQAVHRVVE